MKANRIRMSLTGLAIAALTATSAAQVTTIRVEIDYMEDQFHSHRPEQAEIDAVVDMFACQGITLIVDIDDNIGHTNIMRCASPGNDNFFTCTNSPDSFATYRSLFRDRGAGWHYCIFGHQYDDGDGIDSSGLAEILGNDLFVSDGLLRGQPWTPFWRSATFAHELGHNLGLRHYSPINSNDDPFSPNLPSVMSYQYQLRGVRNRLECLGLVGNDHRFRDLDYSSGRLPSLDESALDESIGVGIRPVNWDCDGTPGELVSKNLNVDDDWCAQGTGSDVIHDFNEWAALTDTADSPGVANDEPIAYTSCASISELMLDAPGACPVLPPTTGLEPCATGQMIFVDPASTAFFPMGTGRSPFRYVSTLTAASPGSVAYLQPGVHITANGTGLVLSSPLVLAGPGGAVISP